MTAQCRMLVGASVGFVLLVAPGAAQARNTGNGGTGTLAVVGCLFMQLRFIGHGLG